MTGSAPTITLGVDAALYAPGTPVTPSVVDVDPDTTTETLPAGPDAEGRDVEVTIARVDPQTASWSWQSGALLTILSGTGLVVTIAAPAASDVLMLTVTDGQGNTVTATVSVDVEVPMLVGVDTSQTGTVSVDVANLSAHVALFPGCVGPTKVFASTGKGLPSWTSGVLAAVPSTWIPYVAFKDFPTQAAWLAWLTAMPARWREVWATYDQEMEGDQPAAQFVSRFQQLLAWSAGHPNRGRLKLGPNYTWYADVNKGYNWRDYWPGAGCDFIAFDLYPAAKTNWLGAPQLQALPLSAAAEVKLPLFYSEIGVVVPASPTPADYAARAAWIASQVSYAREHGVHAMSWWCGTGSQGSFHLDADPAGLRAWRSAVTGQ